VLKEGNIWRWLKVTILVTLALALAGVGCKSRGEPLPAGSSATLVVARDFGREVVLSEGVELARTMSAMDMLKEAAAVEIAYGGGFVNAINGIRSHYTATRSAKDDWFLYINGISAKAGAHDYTIRPGDVERWDFHHWGYRSFVPALIGDFPEPFIHGYRGKVYATVVVYEQSFKEEAEALRDELTELGVNEVSTVETGALSGNDKAHSNLILLGIMDSPLIAKLDEIYRKLGFFARFKDGRLQALDTKGHVAAEYGPGVGIIQATQSPWNPDGVGASKNVVWMVSGVDEAGVRNAAQALINRHDEMRHLFATIVAGEEIIMVPQ